ncbi:MAG TPA: peptidoglycan DD-metalloendopeptidase family protein [Tenuifilaceae bacterium]|nr:peptidoglycan DD-metalloendopeptidase family protein [Tenuifilaceae bacterium]
MDSILIYLIKVSAVQVVLYVFYFALFRTNTLHGLNRATLLSILPFSLLAPAINLNLFVSKNVETLEKIKGTFVEFTVVFPEFIEGNSGGLSSTNVNLLLVAYLSVCAFLLVRFAFQLAKIVRLKKDSLQYNYGKFSFVVSNRAMSPFTFFSWIFIPAKMVESEEFNMVKDHETVHAAMLHTLDLIVVELYCILLWFNPFVYLFRKSLKNVHEFTADSSAIKSSSAKDEYLRLLLACTDSCNILGLTNPFYYQSLKNRVEMITKNKTPKSRKLGYMIYLVLVALVFQAFSFSAKDKSLLVQNNEVAVVAELPSIKPLDKISVSVDFGVTFLNPFTKKEVTHNGIDFRAPLGTPVKATANGVVAKAMEKGNWGNLVVIQHGEEHQTWYAHLNEYIVKEGDTVKKGQVIGYVGNSGQSTGPHLHYMVMKNGEAVNPNDYFKE